MQFFFHSPVCRWFRWLMAWRLALLRPESDDAEAKRQTIFQATHARQFRSVALAKRNLAYDVPAEKLALVCMSIPGAAGMLNIKAFSFQKAPVAGMIRLAMTPRVRGSGAAGGGLAVATPLAALLT